MLAQKAAERDENRRQKLLRQQQSARAQYEKALAELMKQKEALETVSMSVEEVLGPQSTPVRTDMLLDVNSAEDVVIEVEEVEEAKVLNVFFFKIFFKFFFNSQNLL